MIRQRNDPGSPYYAVLAEPNNTLAVEYRSQFGGQTQVATTTTDPGLPLLPDDPAGRGHLPSGHVS